MDALQQISSDTADAAEWRRVKQLTGWQGDAELLAQYVNDTTAQLAQYEAGSAAGVRRQKVALFQACDGVTREEAERMLDAYEAKCKELGL
jgi:hypothetical protein